jgi:hypothetical protein
VGYAPISIRSARIGSKNPYVERLPIEQMV